MAYAAITKTLIDDVVRKINNMRAAEYNAMPDPAVLINEIAADPAVLKAVSEKAWEPVADLRHRLEQYSVKGRYKAIFTGPMPKTGEDAITTIVSFPGQKLPCIYANNDSSYYDGVTLALNVSDEIAPLVLTVREQAAARLECSKRWDAVQTQVVNFLNSCKSANEALKLWPDVARYLTKDVIDRVNQKSEKAQKKESDALNALRALDMDAINSSTVLARMAGAHV